jgi:hypothetical protein
LFKILEDFKLLLLWLFDFPVPLILPWYIFYKYF